MSNSISKHTTLRIFDPDLPLLASEAAVDIENILLNGPKELEAVHLLANLLKNSIQTDTNDAAFQSLMDPPTLSIIGEAVAKSTKTQNGCHKIEYLLNEAGKIADILSQTSHIGDPTELEKARDFCLALSSAALSYRKSIRENSIQAHPFRR